ncbi:type II toxin-antitoxin system RelE/ParE family toxin [uncultured Desulfobulbus sp.]|uniref:type II toxin-antitoxin system RelE/ParE family toxin n=1 Tax=uncultured Desulfobulbus sp. TaxID=239745 RepID=UPI0029C9611A|nr:type II toxin-antitoxin system RelE/ParE family toxin [uncultured Desulfobulbus sp.]
MRFAFKDSDLEEIYDTGFSPKYHPNLIHSFFRTVARIAAAIDERDLYACKSLHIEKLKGGRKGQYSMRLNDQWRLIAIPEIDENGKYIMIIEISDYH